VVAGTAGHERVEYHPSALLSAVLYHADGLVPEYQRRNPASIVPVIGMHIRAADTNCLYLDKSLSSARYRIRFLTILHLKGVCVYECLHGLLAYLAVKPPSR
jgi:hypothetical protein